MGPQFLIGGILLMFTPAIINRWDHERFEDWLANLDLRQYLKASILVQSGMAMIVFGAFLIGVHK